MVFRAYVAVLLAVSLLLWTGCSGGAKFPAAAAVSGKVTLKGAPLAGASVSFVPTEGSPRTASGTTDSGGNYQLTTFAPNDGAPPGKYRVRISKAAASQASPGAVATSDPASQMLKMMQAPKGAKKAEEPSEVPAKYSDVQTSGLDRTVTKEGPNKFDFDLQ